MSCGNHYHYHCCYHDRYHHSKSNNVTTTVTTTTCTATGIANLTALPTANIPVNTINVTITYPLLCPWPHREPR